MKINREDFLILFFIATIGLYVRIIAPLSAIFPLNDGGLFYKMILDIQENHFALPVFTSYNNASLPFAYPPFAFYLYALISEISHTPVIKLMQFLPSLISGLAIPAFFLLAKEILDTKQQVLFSTAAFAFIPRVFEWLIMGGGVTRSLGFLFAILTIRQCILLISTPTTRNLLLSTLLTGLVILTHPEAAVHIFIGMTFIYFWKSRTIDGLKHISLVWLGALLISAPWWAIIITRHGIDPFVAALTSSNQDSYNIITRALILFRFNFTDEPYLTLFSILGLIGMFAMLANHKPALPIWFCLTQLLEPRGGTLYMMIPLSLFVGIALDQVILASFTKDSITNNIKPLRLKARNGFLAFIFLYGILSASITSNKIVQQLTLAEADLNALLWVRDNTPHDSQFIVITQGNPLNDATSEWFPALTNRTSVATIFGREWINNGNFGASLKIYKNLQKCFLRNISCINQWTQENNIEFSYIYIQKMNKEKQPSALADDLKKSTTYKVLYETDEIEVVKKIDGQ